MRIGLMRHTLRARGWLCMAIGLACIYMFAAGQPALAATFTVDSELDAVDSDLTNGLCLNVTVVAGGACTLRAAIQQANANPDPDTIILPDGTYVLTLENSSNNSEEEAASGDLDITSNIIIEGSGAKTTIIEAGEDLEDRLFQLHGDVAVISIRRVTIRNGNPTTLSGGSRAGGGILNNGGTLDLLEIVLNNNSGLDFGGAISNFGTAFLERCAIYDNISSGNNARGGGIWTASDSTLTLANCTVSGNQASIRGGGIDVNNNSDLTILQNTTIANNRLTGPDGGAGISIGNSTQVNLFSSIIADNLAAGNVPDDCDGQFDILDFSLVEVMPDGCIVAGDGENVSSIIGEDPRLAPLADNGGVLLTHALPKGSVAIDAGSQLEPGSGGRACYATDARGVGRPIRAYCDMGSYEAPLLGYMPMLAK